MKESSSQKKLSLPIARCGGGLEKRQGGLFVLFGDRLIGTLQDFFYCHRSSLETSASAAWPGRPRTSDYTQLSQVLPRRHRFSSSVPRHARSTSVSYGSHGTFRHVSGSILNV